MPKARFSSLDTAAIVSHLRSTILGYRISNVYDINPKTYLLKLAKAGEDSKLFLLIESGIRIHATSYCMGMPGFAAHRRIAPARHRARAARHRHPMTLAAPAACAQRARRSSYRRRSR